MTVGKSQLVLKRKPYHDMVMGHCSEHKDLEVFVCLFFPMVYRMGPFIEIVSGER